MIEGSDDGNSEKADDEWSLSSGRKRGGAELVRGKKPKVRREFEHISGDDWVSAAKINKLCEILEQIRANDPTEKVIVFSQVSSRETVLTVVYRIP